jgi:hypothetical protein
MLRHHFFDESDRHFLPLFSQIFSTFARLPIAARARRRVRLQPLSEDEDIPVRIPDHELRFPVRLRAERLDDWHIANL